MNRRGFLGSILAAAAAPAIVRADSLMRIVPRRLFVPTQMEVTIGTVRELWQFDITTGLTLHRFDVFGADPGGAPVLLGVDLHSDVTGVLRPDDRDMALALLRSTAQRDGLALRQWSATSIPDGMRGRFL